MSSAESTSLQSMTGFGAADGDFGPFVWRWELRSVNGKGLDIKFRMPSGTEPLEAKLRQKLRVLHRGSISANLRLDRDTGDEAYKLDEEALASAAAAMNKVRQFIDCERPRPEAVLSMRGVLAGPTDTSLTAPQLDALSEGFDEALAALLRARQTEGARIAALLKERCEKLDALTSSIRPKTTSARDEIATRIRGQISELLKEHVTDERIAQEAAMLAIRADVTEELDRLGVHNAAFTALLDSDGAAGRRLEFLTQELMREANTLTAKLHTAELKSEGLDLKELVDSLREQVLNIA
ncbi:MAG: YicC/YloC family endoribonuclease [Pseudomonadota bacterium]